MARKANWFIEDLSDRIKIVKFTNLIYKSIEEFSVKCKSKRIFTIPVFGYQNILSGI